MTPTDHEWPPRIKITPRGAAGLFLRRFKDASGKDQDDLAEVIEWFIAKAAPVAVQPHRREPPGGRWTCPDCGKSVLRGMVKWHPDDCNLPKEQTP